MPTRTRGARHGGRPRSYIFVAIVATFVIAVLTLAPAGALPEAAGPGILAREPQLTPQELGEAGLDGLQYADPTAELALIEPPVANNQGSAGLDLPLPVPPGRAGVEPSLALTYSSEGGSSWLGTGWDLVVGSVEVDTRWGVPRYESGVESETYLLDGAALSPTAVRAEFEPRVSDRSDFTRRVETEFERIIRHGDSPSNYWWEVTDKLGTTRYYGGTPEGQRDPQAILTDGSGNAFRWALSAERDISDNVIRYSYATVDGTNVGDAGETIGTQLYLESIRYTGSLAGGVDDDPAYEVRFLRDGDISPEPTARRDVAISGRGGFLQVTSELLRRIEVWYGEPAGGDPRDYDILVGGFGLNYEEGAFAKTLLVSIDQIGGDGAVFASHTFDYYDDVRDAEGNYQGFAEPDEWDTGNDNLDQILLGPVGVSALGASETNTGDANIYLGFNPAKGAKTGSFGGAVTIKGGATEGLAEMIDINGDGLPDKVFRESRGGPVKYRLNQGDGTFGSARSVSGISALSTEWNIGIAGGPEAHFGVTAQFSVGGNVTVGEEYFIDVNNDGLPDFVSAGTVYFNHLDESGNPTFTTDSSQTAVPIVSGDADLTSIPGLEQIEEMQEEQSPLQDTVRRWVAPFSGTVSIDAPVTLEPPPDPDADDPFAYDSDGVRVAIQVRGTELWAANLVTPGASETPAGVDGISVSKGDAIYFRVGSVYDGTRDHVEWDPTITYTSPGSPPLDVNGLDQLVYNASEDFTLAGRPGTIVMMPLEGTVKFEATLHKTAETSDDVTVLVLHNGSAVVEETISGDTVTGPEGMDFAAEFDVDAPGEVVDDEVDIDEVEVRLAVDSPIDVTVLEWTPRLYYTEAVIDGEAHSGTDILDAEGNPMFELVVPADIDIYPNNTLNAPSTPWNPTGSGPLEWGIVTSGNHDGGDIVLTVKTRDGLVAKDSITVPPDTGGAFQSELNVDLVPGEDYWIDLSVREPDLAEAINDWGVFRDDGLGGEFQVPATFNWGRQGIFPLAYRGWAYAGYNGQGDRATTAIDEDAFVLDESDFDQQRPDGFDDDQFNDPTQGDAFPYIPGYLDIIDAAGEVVDTVPVWAGGKDNLVGGAGFMRSSRLGADNPAIVSPSGETDLIGDGVSAVRRVGVTAPVLALVAGIGPLSGSIGAGPSFGLLDYLDLNGDGFPDIVSPGSVQYTGPRGGFIDSGSGFDVVRQDVTFAFGGGFSGSAVDIKGNSKGDTNTAQKTAPVSGTGQKAGSTSSSASLGEQASGDQWGVSLGGSLGLGVSLTNPAALDSDWSDAVQAIPGLSDLGLEYEFADVNGDGLPDRVRVAPDGVYVQLNLGYGFAPEIRWTTGGGFENNESYSGSVGGALGFQINNKAFSGGLAYNESVDLARYMWVDVDGDGILDRLRKDGNTIKVAFGTGSGLLPEVEYGDFFEGFLDIAGAELPLGDQIAMGRTRGLGGGASFTIGVGPLCIKACYLIINPGASFEHSIANNQVQFMDIDGDGYPDHVRSTSDDEVEVRRNQRGRTNLLRSVQNPIGGEIRLGYERLGNTVDQPFSQWALASVELDDGRPGDGPDTLLSTFEYSGGSFDHLEREMLGYSLVTERQRAFQGDGNVFDDPVVRVFEREYLNGNVFESGLLVRETLLDPGGSAIKESAAEWQVADLDGTPLDVSGADPLVLLELAASPQRTRLEQRWFESDGSVAKNTWTSYEYDELGNVTRIEDVGEPESSDDNIVTDITYSQCADSTWVSVPATIEVSSGGETLRERDGSHDLCVNGVVSHLIEQIGNGEQAVTDLEFDAWGNYNRIVYPANHAGERYEVEYVYDADRRTDVARVEDSYGLVATATYDGPTGQITSRTDPNGNTTTYEYDPQGRLIAITGPYEQGTGNTTVTFAYFPTDPGYAHATAHHFDAFNPGDTIDTVAFVDGLGRETQTKHDATVYAGSAGPAEDVMIVEGAVEFDALGRPVKEWYPITEPPGTLGTYNAGTASTDPIVTSWTLTDLVAGITMPNGAETSIAYGYGPHGGLTMFETTVTDAEGKDQVSFSNVRGNVLSVADHPSAEYGDGGEEPLITTFSYDPLGQLVAVQDPGGNTTTHEYDLLGRRTATDTPNGGLREFEYDPASNLIAKITPNLRAAGQQIGYEYEFERLVAINYPDGTPNVAYAYGGPGASGNGAGRVVAIEDGARSQQFTYDPLGEVASETSTMLLHNLHDETEERFTFTTEFTYDTWGRLDTMTYPDGEVLQHDYDSGGLLTQVVGEKLGHEYRYLDRREYDEFLDRRYQETGTGVWTEYSYDADSRRLVGIQTTTPDREVQNFNHEYDSVGNVRAIHNLVPDPVPELMGGPSEQTFEYDAYYRLSGAEGSYDFAPGKTREYTYATDFDAIGNLTHKAQTDDIVQPGGNPRIVQRDTTYELDIEFDGDGPHQVSSIGNRIYSYDANGNFSGWRLTRGGQNRTATWDAADRMTSVADQGSTTRYTYDHAGHLAIERGPGGETAFVNQWYTVHNGTVAWKHIWAEDDRIATKRAFQPDAEDPAPYEHMRYFLHKNLQGSTNVITDDRALVFQHLEYFPGGEIWIREHSDVHRTPYLFAGGYFDGFRDLVNLGDRWYEPREQFFYSPDPLLYDDPAQVVDDPALLPAYTYAQSSPLGLADASGRAPFNVRAAFSHAFERVFRASPKDQQTGDAADRSPDRSSRMWQPLASFAASPFATKLQAFSDRFDAQPLVQVNLVKSKGRWALQDVKVSPTFFLKQFRVVKGAAAAQQPGAVDTADPASPPVQTADRRRAAEAPAQAGRPRAASSPPPVDRRPAAHTRQRSASAPPPVSSAP